jgi:hypothetical protein
MPAPMITTGSSALAAAGTCATHAGSRWSTPSSSSSSNSSGTYSAGTWSTTRKSIISCTSSGDGGGGRGQPRSRQSHSAAWAFARAAAWSSGAMNPWTSLR